MQSGAFATVTSLGGHRASDAPRAKPLPARVEHAIARVEWVATMDAIVDLERELAAALELDTTLVLWFDWYERRASSPHGPVSPRVEELVREAAGGRRRVVCENAIVEPIGSAPACAALVAKADPEHLFAPHVLRTITRVVERIAPVVLRIHRAT